MVINIHAQGIELTDALKTYAEEKAISLDKYFDGIRQIDLTIGMESHHHQKGKIFFTEMIVHVPGTPIVIKKEAEDLYKSIDKVRDHLKVEFDKLKGKMRHKDRQHIRDQKAYSDV